MEPIEHTTFLQIDAFHYKNTYRRFCPSEGGLKKGDAIFPTMWELFVWGAILGYKKSLPKELEKRQPSPPFRWQVIKEPHNKLLMVFAVQSVNEFDILKDPEALKKNIEEHSNGGLHLMHERLALDHTAYDNVESLIEELQDRLSN